MILWYSNNHAMYKYVLDLNTFHAYKIKQYSYLKESFIFSDTSKDIKCS